MITLTDLLLRAEEYVDTQNIGCGIARGIWDAAEDFGLTQGFPLGEGFTNLHPVLSEDNVGRFIGWLVEWDRITLN